MKNEKNVSKKEQKRLAGNAAIRYRNACVDYFRACTSGNANAEAMADAMKALNDSYFSMLDANGIRYRVPEEIVRMACAKIKATKETGAIHIDMKNVPSIIRAASASDIFVDAKHMEEKKAAEPRKKAEKVQLAPEVEGQRKRYNLEKQIARANFQLAQLAKPIDAPEVEFKFPTLPEWYAANIAA